MTTTAFGPPAANNNFYINPAQTGPSPPHNNNDQQDKPLYANINTTGSGNVSPTNYHAAAVRHIRQPRQPMYVPAALRPPEYSGRPTDIPNRPRGMESPPSSKESSLGRSGSGSGSTSSSGKAASGISPSTTNSSASTAATSTTSVQPTTTAGGKLAQTDSHHSSASFSSTSQQRSSPVSPSTSRSNSAAGPTTTLSPARSSATWPLLNTTPTSPTSPTYLLSPSWSHPSDPVTSPPSTAHWKPDESSPSCAICQQRFSLFFRRHHCRRCGEVVCGAHSTGNVPLDQNARFHPRGLRVKGCDFCVGEWVRGCSAGAAGRVDSVGEEGFLGGSGDVTPTGSAGRPILGGNRRGLGVGEDGEEVERDVRVGSMARSEGGMIWSTF